MRATLENVLTEEAYAQMLRARPSGSPPASRAVIADAPSALDREAPRCARRVLVPRPRRREAAARPRSRIDPELDRYLHLAALNRGILMTPFHNMALMSPATTDADVDRHTAVFAESVAALLA